MLVMFWVIQSSGFLIYWWLTLSVKHGCGNHCICCVWLMLLSALFCPLVSFCSFFTGCLVWTSLLFSLRGLQSLPLFCFLLYFPLLFLLNLVYCFIVWLLFITFIVYKAECTIFVCVFVLLRLTPAELYYYPCYMAELGSTSTADTSSCSESAAAAWRLYYFGFFWILWGKRGKLSKSDYVT